MDVYETTTKKNLPSTSLPGGRTAWELIFERAFQAPDAVTIAALGRSPLCFGDLKRHITTLAIALNVEGVRRNSRVALVLPSGPEMATAFLAVASSATCAPLNPEYTAEEFEFFLDHLQARALIVPAGRDSPAQAVTRRLGIQEMIDRGGEKISPRGIAAAIESHPDVRAVATFGIPHPTLGEEVVAAAIKESDAAIGESDIAAWVRQRMGSTRAPRRIYFVDQLQRTESGKVRRSDLSRLLGLDQPRVTRAHESRVAEAQSPASPPEAALAEVWMSVLEVTNEGSDDDFFPLGGDSLRGTRLLTSVKAVFGLELTKRALFWEAARVAGMACAIETVRSANAIVRHE